MLRAGFHLGTVLVVSVGIAGAQTTRPKPLPPVEAMKRPLVRPVISGPAMLALEQFRKLVGVRMSVNLSALAEAGVKESDKVNIRLDRGTGEQVLDLMLSKLSKKARPLAWYIERDTVHVTTQAEVLYRRRLPAPGYTQRVRGRRGGIPPPRKPKPIRQMTFDETPLEDVIEHLRLFSGLNMHVNWASLETIGVDRDTPVTLKVSRVALRQVLSLVTDQLGSTRDKMERVYWVLDGGIITIATGTALNRKMRTTVYNVADLLAVVPNFEAPARTLHREDQTSGGGRASDSRGFGDDQTDGEDSADEDVAAQRQNARDTLIAIIRDAIGEDMWQPVGKGSVRVFGNKLVISQSLLGFKLLGEAARPR